MEILITKVQKFTVMALAAMLVVVMILSTAHLGVLIVQKIWEPPRWLIAVQGLLEIFGYFLLVLIGVDLLETLKAYVRKDVIHVRVVLEVALAMAREVIIEEPNTVPGVTLFGIAALILAFGIAFFFERHAKRENRAWDLVTRRQAIKDVVTSNDRARAKEVPQEEVGFRHLFLPRSYGLPALCARQHSFRRQPLRQPKLNLRRLSIRFDGRLRGVPWRAC